MATLTARKTYLERAFEDDLARLEGESGRKCILYVAADHSARWTYPADRVRTEEKLRADEKVRAELWAELIYRYEYPAERIGVEVTIQGRTTNLYADLVIYEDDDHKSPYFIFECKREDLSDPAFDQAIEQACAYRAGLRAKYCGVVAGRTRRLLRFDRNRFPPGERERNIFTDIPVRYGQPPAWRFLKGDARQDLPAVAREELQAAIRKCHQTLWEGGKRSPIVAFGEFCKLVFIKYRDEKNPDLEPGQPYNFQRREGETNRQLADRIHRLYDAEQRQQPAVFTESINVEPPVLAQCVEHLEGISLNNTELDTKGVAFEEFMGGFFKGDFGQYFTPRELIAFAVAVLQPQRTDLVLDPACGSGGFLLHALDHVRRVADRRFPEHRTDPRQSVEHFQYWHDFAQSNLFGIEINDALARVAKMNMIIHDDGHTNIVGHDALDFFDHLTARKGDLAAGKFDLILTNPPFGSIVRRSERGDDYLAQFDLRRYVGRNYPDDSAKPLNIKTEILFLERVHSFLKPGTGRAAVVLPDGVLTNSSLQGVRHWLLANFQLLAVVSLPQTAFSHYDAGVKASIVFLRRRAAGESISDEEAIFMALAENIGYDATGRETFAKTVESEEPGRERVEIHSCDLFDYRVFYEWRDGGVKGESGWQERRRELIPDTGLARQYKEFQRDPTPFLV